MKRIIYLLLLIFLFSNIYLIEAQTEAGLFKKHSGDFSLKLLNFQYKEPDFMKEDGIMYGIGASYTYNTKLMFRIGLDYYSGEIQYSSESGKADGIRQNIIESRCLIGYNFIKESSPLYNYITLYTGLGYRYWEDNSGGNVTNLGKYGYDRETTYYYGPVGLEITKELRGFILGTTIEYDFFYSGENKTYLSNVDSSAPDLKFDQKNGHGTRFAINLKKNLDRVNIGGEIFLNYWDIDESDEIAIYDPTDASWYVFVEPQNRTTEVGLNFIIEF